MQYPLRCAYTESIGIRKPEEKEKGTMVTVKEANKTQMKRVVKMLNEYFGESRFADAVIDGNTIAWDGKYEWNEKFNEWFHRNKAFFNCGNLWYENQNGYSISVYCG